MRKLFFTAAAFMLAVMLFVSKTANGQTWLKGYYLEKSNRGFYIKRKSVVEGDGFMLLRAGDFIAFSIDYSEAIIKGLSEHDYADLVGKAEWEETKASLRKSFLRVFADNMGRKEVYMFGADRADAKYRITLQVEKIDRRGNMDGPFFLEKIGDDNNVYAKIKLSGDGGRIGSFVNLMGDGHRDMSEKFAKFLKRQISQGQRKNYDDIED